MNLAELYMKHNPDSKISDLHFFMMDWGFGGYLPHYIPRVRELQEELMAERRVKAESWIYENSKILNKKDMSKVKKYRKLPVVIEAVQWTGDNDIDIINFAGIGLRFSKPPVVMKYNIDPPNEAFNVKIPTLEGDMIAIKGDYIIKGVNGEFYPCKPDIFAKTYEEVGESVLDQGKEYVSKIEDIKEKIGEFSEDRKNRQDMLLLLVKNNWIMANDDPENARYVPENYKDIPGEIVSMDLETAYKFLSRTNSNEALEKGYQESSKEFTLEQKKEILKRSGWCFTPSGTSYSRKGYDGPALSLLDAFQLQLKENYESREHYMKHINSYSSIPNESISVIKSFHPLTPEECFKEFNKQPLERKLYKNRFERYRTLSDYISKIMEDKLEAESFPFEKDKLPGMYELNYESYHMLIELTEKINNLLEIKKMDNKQSTLQENDKEFHAYKFPDLDARNMSQEDFAKQKTDQHESVQAVNNDPEGRGSTEYTSSSEGYTYRTDANLEYVKELQTSEKGLEYAKGLVIEFFKKLPYDELEKLVDFKSETVGDRVHFLISLKK